MAPGLRDPLAGLETQAEHLQLRANERTCFGWGCPLEQMVLFIPSAAEGP
jgi:hypothetical protein